MDKPHEREAHLRCRVQEFAKIVAKGETYKIPQLRDSIDEWMRFWEGISHERNSS